MSWARRPLTLDTLTAAGRDLTFICCDLPTDVWEGGAATYTRMAAFAGGRPRRRDPHSAEGTEGVSDGIVVANIDGSGRANLSASRGCRNPGLGDLVARSIGTRRGGVPSVQRRDLSRDSRPRPKTTSIFIVPVDGSPVRELLDDTAGWLWTPAWSPDGSTFATVRRECASREAPPQCSSPDITSSLMLVAAEDGTSRVLVTSDQLGEGLTELGLPLWSRDGARIAFSAFNCERGRITCLRGRR